MKHTVVKNTLSDIVLVLNNHVFYLTESEVIDLIVDLKLILKDDE